MLHDQNMDAESLAYSECLKVVILIIVDGYLFYVHTTCYRSNLHQECQKTKDLCEF